MMIAMSNYIRWILLLILPVTVIVYSSCSSNSKISNKNLAYLYSPGTNFIHPEFKVVNISYDTSRLFFKIPAEELLYVKSDTGISFYTSFSVSYKLVPSFESKEIRDTGIVYYNFIQNDSIEFISGEMDLRVSSGFDYILQVFITDHHKNKAVSTFLTIDKTGDQSPNNFLLLDAFNNEPIMYDFVSTDTDIRIISTLNDNDSIWLRYYEIEHRLPRPPFSVNQVHEVNFHAGTLQKIKFGPTEIVSLQDEGIYHLHFDTLSREGVTIMRFEEDFPQITSASDLVEPLRYLTTNDEYQRLRNSENKKEAIDNYWLKLSGNRERGKVLIKQFYSRVQFSNQFFSSYREGWKTDKGLIYIIFGPPGTVYISDESESWNYGQLNSYSSLIFTFDKIDNPFTDNDYQLRRAAHYEVPWYRSVESWRSGRVVNDAY